jgi:hypothetical protein
MRATDILSNHKHDRRGNQRKFKKNWNDSKKEDDDGSTKSHMILKRKTLSLFIRRTRLSSSNAALKGSTPI